MPSTSTGIPSASIRSPISPFVVSEMTYGKKISFVDVFQDFKQHHFSATGGKTGDDYYQFQIYT